MMSNSCTIMYPKIMNYLIPLPMKGSLNSVQSGLLRMNAKPAKAAQQKWMER